MTRTKMLISTSSKDDSSSATARIRHHFQAQSSSIRTGASVTIDKAKCIAKTTKSYTLRRDRLKYVKKRSERNGKRTEPKTNN